MYVNDDRALKKSWEKEINNRKNTEQKHCTFRLTVNEKNVYH